MLHSRISCTVGFVDNRTLLLVTAGDDSTLNKNKIEVLEKVSQALHDDVITDQLTPNEVVQISLGVTSFMSLLVIQLFLRGFNYYKLQIRKRKTYPMDN